MIKSHLLRHNISYESLNGLISFQKDYHFLRQRIISNHQLLIEQERERLSVDIPQLSDLIEKRKSAIEHQLMLKRENLMLQLGSFPTTHTNIIQAFVDYIKKSWLKLKIVVNKLTLNFRMAWSVRPLDKIYNQENTRYQYIIRNPGDAVLQSSMPQLKEHDYKKSVIDKVNNSIYGAIGEQRVVSELSKLPDDCILINDFGCRFQSPIYNRNGNDYIKSIQIDHILIAPSGVFLIETKNWSQQSLDNPNLYSPVQQIRRANFALYKILNEKFAKLILQKHHWGQRKISLRNLIVFMDNKPAEEFQFVKTLTLNKLVGHIKYFEPCLTNQETQTIVNYLLKIQ